MACGEGRGAQQAQRSARGNGVRVYIFEWPSHRPLFTAFLPAPCRCNGMVLRAQLSEPWARRLWLLSCFLGLLLLFPAVFFLSLLFLSFFFLFFPLLCLSRPGLNCRRFMPFCFRSIRGAVRTCPNNNHSCDSSS